MIRILLRLVPGTAKPLAARYAALLAAVVVARAATCVLLVPVLARLFSGEPGDAAGWVALFVAVAATHGALQHRLARTGFALGGVAAAEIPGIVAAVKWLAARGAAVVVVDHDHGFVEQVADRVVELAEGRIVPCAPSSSPTPTSGRARAGASSTG